MGVFSGQEILEGQQWEQLKRAGDRAIASWINRQMADKDAVIVLVGSDTARQRWVQYEINHAREEHIPMLGVRIHGLRDFAGDTSKAGDNPFDYLEKPYSKEALHDPTRLDSSYRIDSKATYANIENNLQKWVEETICIRKLFGWR